MSEESGSYSTGGDTRHALKLREYVCVFACGGLFVTQAETKSAARQECAAKVGKPWKVLATKSRM